MFDFKKLAEQLQGLIDLLDFFSSSGMERFDYDLMGKYTLTIYKVSGIIRIDIKPVAKGGEK